MCKRVYAKSYSQSLKSFNERSRFCSRECLGKWNGNHQGQKTQFKKGDGRNLWWKEAGMSAPPCAGWNKKYENGAPIEVVREWRRKGMKKYRSSEKNLEKIKARSFLNDRVRSGDVKRLPCELCAHHESEAHHHKGYAEENWLNVQWLCKQCHEKNHKLNQ